MISTDIVVPEASQITRFSCLADLKDGLPRVMNWQKGRFGPSQGFIFDRLSHLDALEERDFRSPDGSHVQCLIVIGTFRYEFADVIKEDDVCLDLKSCSLWRFVEPEVLMYLNSSASCFCLAFKMFDMLLASLPSKSREARREEWHAFELYLRSIDQNVFQHQVSFWPDIIGEAILQY